MRRLGSSGNPKWQTLDGKADRRRILYLLMLTYLFFAAIQSNLLRYKYKGWSNIVLPTQKLRVNKLVSFVAVWYCRMCQHYVFNSMISEQFFAFYTFSLKLTKKRELWYYKITYFLYWHQWNIYSVYHLSGVDFIVEQEKINLKAA